MSTERPNPWAGATIVKLSVVRSGSPLAFFSARFPLLEATLVDCTLRRTKAGRLWCTPPKRRRVLADGTAQYDDIIEWDGGGPASRFSQRLHGGDPAPRSRAADAAPRGAGACTGIARRAWPGDRERLTRRQPS